ncbi:type I-E CRISPR-associated protein Cas7/Cse4/CasC [Thiolapillus brandeum]|uniref:CRISPR-associated CSE4 family protein n=1 Tax=Thiolapillus brandeum TaxID=1076588 RepID=A0A7U6JI49_9GAMM|nr:type I-E CRISPR-associated protein Cas7/Cse4/CasC [Thiolapillus brandeum]BAO44423.1 CRISPR-associated CSE4 family protein [Thiolapillus brandeum]
MTQFIQLHMLTAYPPSNLNRDDLGRPKTAIVGGTERLRISSQSLKRAWRTSEHFESALADFRGTRTKRLGEQVFEGLIEKGVSESKAKKWAAEIAGVFGKLKKDSFEIEQLAHVSPEERQAVENLVDTLANEDRAPEKEELNLLRKNPKAVDIALFGRMLASSPAYNVEAATQVAHAITVNQVKIEDDFFTAVDDLNTHEEDAGAGHMGDAGFSSGIFYQYICIDRDRLVENLQGDEELAQQAIAALVEAAAKVAPTGKQNSFASRAYTSYLLAEKGSQQPRSLSVAFLQAVRGGDLLGTAIQRLEQQRDNFDKVYGDCADQRCSLNAQTGEGSLQDIIDFVKA